MASHEGGEYIVEQTCGENEKNMPGIVSYKRENDRIYRRSSSLFGPGDLFCSLWHVLSLAGVGEEEWTPQYNYWKRPAPAQMEDGGQNLQ